VIITLRVPRARAAVGIVVAACAVARPAIAQLRPAHPFVDILIDVPSRAPHIYIPLLDALIRVNLWSLRREPLPPLYASGVVYEREEEGQEIWLCSPALYAAGKGDCEDLASHRTAELLLQGIPAQVRLTYQPKAGGLLWHVTVKRGTRVEDPSARLGMRGAA
jgi:hypothetical protein